MISTGEIIYRIQENPLLRAVKTSDIINHIKTVVELVGVPGLKEEKSIYLTIIDYRCQLPSDFLSRVAVRWIDPSTKNAITTLSHTTDLFGEFTSISGTDTQTQVLLTHKIVNGFIYTDFKEGEIQLLYTAYCVDEKGWPMIPRNESLVLAIENYIKARYYGILADQNAQFERAYIRAEQQYVWYVAQATNSLLHLDPVEAEALGRALTRMVRFEGQFESSNKYSGQKEVLNRRIW